MNNQTHVTREQVLDVVRGGARLPVDLVEDLGKDALRVAAELWVDGVLDWDGTQFVEVSA